MFAMAVKLILFTSVQIQTPTFSKVPFNAGQRLAEGRKLATLPIRFLA